MNLKEIKELIDLITEKNLAEFEMEKAGFKIKIARNQPHTHQRSDGAGTLTQVESTSMMTPAGQAGGPAAPARVDIGPPAENFTPVKSPIVGTFYRAPDPNTPPFVKEGDRVSKGQVLCIIEAMKLMNEIEAELPGEIVKILVENGQPVEYGQEIFLIRPTF